MSYAVVMVRGHGAIEIHPNLAQQQQFYEQCTIVNTPINLSVISFTEMGRCAYSPFNFDAVKFIQQVRSAYKRLPVGEKEDMKRFLLNALSTHSSHTIRMNSDAVNYSLNPKIYEVGHQYLEKFYTKFDSNSGVFNVFCQYDAIVCQMLNNACAHLTSMMLESDTSFIFRSNIVQACESAGIQNLIIIDYTCDVFASHTIDINQLSQVHADWLTHHITANNLKGGRRTKRRHRKLKRRLM